jgi:hypothetical protein
MKTVVTEQLSLFDDSTKWREEMRRDQERREREYREYRARLDREADERRCRRYGLVICPECEGRYTVDFPPEGRHKCPRCDGYRFLWPDGHKLTNAERTAAFFEDELPLV